ncbi:MAG: hypothetical protein JNM68_09105 [Dinghuibacter sp.]|nr:hypothetical protein [Dinghuibacter sp.]
MKTNPKETKKRKLQLSKKTVIALTSNQTQVAWGGDKTKTSGWGTCPTFGVETTVC